MPQPFEARHYFPQIAVIRKNTLHCCLCLLYLASCVCYSQLAVSVILSTGYEARAVFFFVCFFVFVFLNPFIHTFYIINQRWIIFTEIDQVILKKERNCYFHCTNHKHKFLSKYHSTHTCFPYLHVYNCPYSEVVNLVWL